MLPVLTAARAERIFMGIGFKYVRARGGHRIYVKGKHAVIIPFHAGDLKRKTLKSIIAQSGLTLEQFRKLL